MREIRDNKVPLEDWAADLILAVNLLHEVVDETAIDEMRRLEVQLERALPTARGYGAVGPRLFLCPERDA